MYPAAIHSLAHRAPHKAPPATRTRVRWQPYNSTTTPCLNTPSSTTPSSSPTLSCAQQPSQPPSSSSKSKYASSLVDQAVKSLSEIWQPQDIPIVFLTSSRASVPGSTDSHIPTPPPRRTSTLNQLPSPVSPSTPSCPSQAQPLDPTGAASLPIKPFVHEVLRRSRTSGTVLQTALCYLEAIRPKIPSLVQKDKSGIPTSKEPELASRITIATEAEPSDGIDQSNSIEDTVKVFDAGECPCDSGCADSGYGSGCSTSSGSESGLETLPLATPPPASADLAPLPPLPSPLLCPRRAFLASLILASKFTQDKTYSNRAWAKLSGLPPREIGRCERALGEELGWRLWVGKTPVSSEKVVEEAPVGNGKTRPVARCQSENNLRSASAVFLVPASAPVKPLLNRSGSGLRRSSTLPAEAFTQRTPQPQRKSHLNNVVTQWIHNSSRQDTDTQMYSPTLSIEECCSNSGFGDETPSPCPPTPGLSYSPSSSSGSSGGDRTIQMSTFLDDLSLNTNNNNSGLWNMNSIFGVACPPGIGNENQHGFCSYESKAKNDVFSPDVWGMTPGVGGVGMGVGVRMVGVGTIV